MIDQVLALIVDEGKWLTVSMGLALLVALGPLLWRSHSDVTAHRKILAAMNLFFGVTIGCMACGHLLAVSTKLALGTMREGSLVYFYGIGFVLAVPSWWLILHTRKMLTSSAGEPARERTTMVLNAWTVATLLALGLHNLPLAIQGLFNIGYLRHSRPAVGWGLVCGTVVVGIGLFIASLVFLLSGQSFEQFSGM